MSEWWDKAVRCARAGQWRQAAECVRRVLQAQPGNADAWQLLASATAALGQHAAAAEAYTKALELRPGLADLHCGLAHALAGLGQPQQAAEQYRQALRLDPDHADAAMHCGIGLAQQGRLAEALPLLRRAVVASPASATAQHNLGVALAQSGQKEEALHHLGEAVRLNPQYADGHANLGNVLHDLKRHEEAVEHYRQAVRLRPDWAAACCNLGLAYSDTRRHAEAILILGHATRLDPAAKEAWNNLGLAYADVGRFAEAQAAYEQALKLDPKYVEALANLGSCCKEQGRLDEALAAYELALWLEPQSVSAQYNRALTLLQKGDYAQGWPAYEWRWTRAASPMRPFPHPRWNGEPLEGKTILLWCEQGVGDGMQFVRYAPLVKARGGTVLLECPPGLTRLMATCPGVDRALPGGEGLPPFDVQIPLMSLPAVFGTTPETVPADIPYLSAEPQRVQRWKERLAEVNGYRVGVAWQGNPRFGWDHFRSFPLAALAPLAAVAGVRLISLQKGPGTEQLRGLKGQFDVVDLGEELDADGAFLDTAAVMQHLDLVVSADTAAAHLAGALAVPVWVAVAAVSDWRWLVGRDDTPWYPTMRLFRQGRLHDWPGVFCRIADDLRNRRSPPAHRTEVDPAYCVNGPGALSSERRAGS
jgi:tetratricopeptide (TPR) repeat protein